MVNHYHVDVAWSLHVSIPREVLVPKRRTMYSASSGSGSGGRGGHLVPDDHGPVRAGALLAAHCITTEETGSAQRFIAAQIPTRKAAASRFPLQSLPGGLCALAARPYVAPAEF